MKHIKSKALAGGAALLGAAGLFLGAPPAHATTFASGGIFGVGANLCVHNPLGHGGVTLLYLEYCGNSNEQFNMNSTSYGGGWVDFVYSDTSHGSYCITDVDSSGHNGNPMELEGCNGSRNQAFQIGCMSAQGRSGSWSYLKSPGGYSFNDYGGAEQPGDTLAQWTLESPLPTSEIFDPMGYNTCSSGD